MCLDAIDTVGHFRRLMRSENLEDYLYHYTCREAWPYNNMLTSILQHTRIDVLVQECKNIK